MQPVLPLVPPLRSLQELLKGIFKKVTYDCVHTECLLCFIFVPSVMADGERFGSSSFSRQYVKVYFDKMLNPKLPLFQW